MLDMNASQFITWSRLLDQKHALADWSVCSGWSAAVEALAAFVKSFVFPNMSVTEEGILLQPIIGYLSGYVSIHVMVKFEIRLLS